jgi:transposase
MAKSKWPQVQERLELVKKWCRDGLSEKQIATNLRISPSTMETYKKKHPELLEALKKGKEPFLAEVENALAKRAIGFEYEETKTYIKYEEGKEVRYTEKTKKYQPPNVAACSILLKNKDRGNWSDNPQKLDMDRELLELKKEMERMKVF